MFCAPYWKAASSPAERCGPWYSEPKSMKTPKSSAALLYACAIVSSELTILAVWIPWLMMVVSTAFAIFP